MQIPNLDKHRKSNDHGWQFLIEYPLSEFMQDYEKGGGFTTGLLDQTIRELGIPLEYLENINVMLAGFVKLALVNFEHYGSKLPALIRVFCQKKVMDDANVAKTSRPDHAEPTMESVPIKDPSGTILNRGWGYFFIDRSGCDAGSSEMPSLLVDIFIYQEGE